MRCGLVIEKVILVVGSGTEADGEGLSIDFWHGLDIGQGDIWTTVWALEPGTLLRHFLFQHVLLLLQEVIHADDVLRLRRQIFDDVRLHLLQVFSIDDAILDQRQFQFLTKGDKNQLLTHVDKKESLWLEEKPRNAQPYNGPIRS